MEMTCQQNHMPDRSGPGHTAGTPSFITTGGGGDKSAIGGRDEVTRRKVMKGEIAIATWNVRPLRQCGKLEVIVN